MQHSGHADMPTNEHPVNFPVLANNLGLAMQNSITLADPTQTIFSFHDDDGEAPDKSINDQSLSHPIDSESQAQISSCERIRHMIP